MAKVVSLEPGAMGKMMLTCCDTQTGEEVVDDGPDGGLELQRDPEGLDAAVHGDTDDEGDVQPVDMLIPVLTGDGGISDMDLLRPRGVCRLCRHDDDGPFSMDLTQCQRLSSRKEK